MSKSPEEIVEEFYPVGNHSQPILVVNKKVIIHPVGKKNSPYTWINLFMLKCTLQIKETEVYGTGWKTLYKEDVDDLITALLYIKQEYFS